MTTPCNSISILFMESSESMIQICLGECSYKKIVYSINLNIFEKR